MRTHLTWGVLGGSVVVVVALGACSSTPTFISGADDGGNAPDTTTGGPGDDGATGTDGTTGTDTAPPPPPEDASSDVILQPDTNPPPPPDPCTDVASDQVGTFASPTGTGTLATGCALVAPCPSINDALTAAVKTSRSLVYVDKGTYVEQLNLTAAKDHSGFKIQGGWEKSGSGAGSTWKQICDGSQATLAIIVAPAGQNITAIAQDLNAEVTLDKINLHARTAPPAAAGESIYGIVATGTTTKLKLNGVGIVVPKGGDGTAGGTGTAGAGGAASCAAGSGGTPGAGGSGAGSGTGTFSVGGYQSSSNGTVGSAGGQGGNGTAPPGQCSAGAVTCSDCGTDPGPPVMRCVDIGQTTAKVCGSPGIPGCGSGGGGGGSPGTSAGSSVALFLWGATADMGYSTLTSGAGGTGGAGGAGGTAGAATAGATGAAFLCVDTCTPAANNVCNQTGTTYAGGIGTAGSPGSAGGQGGGGSGGYSYAYYTGGGAAATTGVNVTFNHGAAGAPGAGGNPAGAAGIGADHN